MAVAKWLKLEKESGFYESFPLLPQMKIGRSTENNIVVSDNSVSAHHATIWTEDEKVFIRDEHSTNGTLVNGEPITHVRELHHMDIVHIGHLRTIFVMEEAAATQPMFPLYLSLSYFHRMREGETCALDIVLTHKPNEKFPEQSVSAFESVSGPHAVIQILPVFPGCACSPPVIELNKETNTARIWITPLVPRLSAQGCLHIRQTSRQQEIQVPFAIRTARPAFALLQTALWLPLFLVFMNLLNLRLRSDLSGAAMMIGQIILAMGGLLPCAMLCGLILLLLATFCYLRTRPLSGILCNRRLDKEA